MGGGGLSSPPTLRGRGAEGDGLRDRCESLLQLHFILEVSAPSQPLRCTAAPHAQAPGPNLLLLVQQMRRVLLPLTVFVHDSLSASTREAADFCQAKS